MIIVADTGPVNYLALSDQIGLVHVLYGTLLVPSSARVPVPQRQSAVTQSLSVFDNVKISACARLLGLKSASTGRVEKSSLPCALVARIRLASLGP